MKKIICAGYYKNIISKSCIDVQKVVSCQDEDSAVLSCWLGDCFRQARKSGLRVCGNNTIQRAGVEYILDSVVDELINDPNKRFIWVETAFFWQWWLEQDDALRSRVVQLVNDGQLEFTGGAWSMHDEASTHYHSIIDQFTWGFKTLKDLFGTCARPRIGWQIDPFGHARETASLMAQMGFDGLFFARLDYQDKQVRMETKTAEMVWQASENLGASSWLFTHALYNHYSPPPGFCFDISCRNVDPIIDNKNSQEYNVDRRVDRFIELMHEQAASYASQNLIILMGEDFQYQSARMWFKNMDKLIKYVNERQVNGSDINLFYSTPACYVKAVSAENLKWPTKYDDFFPYPNDANSYWTGYFTSRPTLKYFERKGNNLLQVTKQLMSLHGHAETSWNDLSSLREMMGVMQHHDAITGTEKQHVANNYALKLDWAFQDAQTTVEHVLNTMMAKSSNSPVLTMQRCQLLNISQCATTETSDNFVVTAYNPLSHVTSQYVRLPVQAATYRVLDPQGVIMVSQLVPIPNPVIAIPGRVSSATQELVFQTVDLPPLGFKSYYVEKLSSLIAESVLPKTSIGNQRISVRLEEGTGRMLGVSLDGKLEIPLEHNFFYYEGSSGMVGRSSGAYVFRPEPGVPVTKLTVNTSTSATGNNGREVLERKRDFRPTWDVTIAEPESGNYYPITTSLAITNGSNTVAVLPDRAQGGSSLVDGDLELMALNEMAYGVGLVARGRHVVLVSDGTETTSASARQRQLIQSRNVLAPWLTFSSTLLSPAQWRDQYYTEFSGLNASAIPENVQVLTLEPWGTGRVLLRLEHFFEAGDDPVLSQPASVIIEDIFPTLLITAVEETLLGGNAPVTMKSERLQWHLQEEQHETMQEDVEPSIRQARAAVSLQPMQIRTFILDVSVKGHEDHSVASSLLHASVAAPMSLMLLAMLV
ncbi:hypothetical protein B566_EDAN009008 [Ephemera danica]|nr:hypothetical protein B566_EDAN009008 [Ephemera danica]